MQHRVVVGYILAQPISPIVQGHAAQEFLVCVTSHKTDDLIYTMPEA
jgi:hypothetical protein